MATRFAVKSGLWSDPTVWSNGALPLAADDVYPNGFTVTIDQNVTVASLLNAARARIIATPVMTSNNAPSPYIVSASDNNSFVWNCFNQNTATNNYGGFGGSTGWVKIFTGTGFVLDAYSIYGADNITNSPQNWTMEGSNDNINWTILDTVALASPIAVGGVYNSSSIGNNTLYTYYRLNVTLLGGGTSARISDIFLYEKYSGTINVGGTFSLNGGITVNAIVNGGATTTPTITYSQSSPASSTINGNISGSSTNGTVSKTGTGTLTINGNLTGGIVAGAAVGVGSAGIVNIVGNLTNGEVSGNYSTGLTVFGGGAGSTINITGSVQSNNGSGNTPFYTSLFVQANCTINIIGSVYGVVAGGGSSTNRTTFLTTQPCTVNITGSVYGGSIPSTTINVPAITLTGASTINVTGDVYGGTGSISPAIFTNGGTCTIIGNVYGGTSAQNSAAISPSNATTISLTGNALGGTSFAAIHSTTASPITVNGNINASGTYAGVFSSGASTVVVNGTVTASSGAVGLNLSSISAVLTMSGNLVNNANGTMAAQVYKMYLTNTPSSWRFTSASGGTNTALYTSNYAPNYPSVYDVKTGVSYNGGLMVGIMNVPPVGTVIEGVPVGTTVGTALLSKAAIQAAMWDKPTSELTVNNTIGARAKNAITSDILGQQLANL